MWSLEACDAKAANIRNFRHVLLYRINLCNMNPGAKLCVLINSKPNQEAIILLVDWMLNDTWGDIEEVWKMSLLCGCSSNYLKNPEIEVYIEKLVIALALGLAWSPSSQFTSPPPHSIIRTSRGVCPDSGQSGFGPDCICHFLPAFASILLFLLIPNMSFLEPVLF